MNRQALGNNLRTHRKRSGLSQRELGLLLGYKNQWQVSRHERSQTAPPLTTALAYQAIFQQPVSVLFEGIHSNVVQEIETRLITFEQSLNPNPGKGRQGRVIAQKIEWLTKRRS